MWRNLSATYNARLIIIECVLEKELHKKRIEDRVRNMHGISEVTWDDVENRRKEYLQWEEKRLIINTSATIENNVRRAMEYITAAEQEEYKPAHETEQGCR